MFTDRCEEIVVLLPYPKCQFMCRSKFIGIFILR